MRTKHIIGITGLIAAGAFVSSSFGQNGPRGIGPQAMPGLQNQQCPLLDVVGEPSAAEIETMLFMKEEEKFSRDVYNALAKTWDATLFSRIAQAEQRHLDAVTRLIDAYEIVDTTPSEVGVFSIPELQTLYTDLVAKGSESQAAAIEVGISIESMDIQDLTEALAETTDPAQIRIYSNLLRASSRHLTAFTRAKANDTLDCIQLGFGPRNGGNRGPCRIGCSVQNGGLGGRGIGQARNPRRGLGQYGPCPLGLVPGTGTAVRDDSGPNR